MKKALILLASLFIFDFALAQQAPEILIQKGVRELRTSGSIDFDSFQGSSIDLNVGYGYFVNDYFLFGAEMDIHNSDWTKAYGVNLFGEYNYDSLTYWIPFVGLRAGYRVFDADVPNGFTFEDSGAVVGPYGGVKYYFTRSIAWTAQLDIDWASGDLYEAEDGATNLDTKLSMGIRVHF